VLRGLLDAPSASERELASSIDVYLEVVRQRAQRQEFVDLALATRIARSAKLMIGALSPDTPADVRGLVQAAIRYFVLEEDAEADISSPIGFDDDRDVFNAVARFMSRDDLCV
jgi:uncharacterized membrane protein YkvA (DUF1232 family)